MIIPEIVENGHDRVKELVSFWYNHNIYVTKGLTLTLSAMFVLVFIGETKYTKTCGENKFVKVEIILY